MFAVSPNKTKNESHSQLIHKLSVEFNLHEIKVQNHNFEDDNKPSNY